MNKRDVVVIGAGPAGAIASAILKRRGWDVLVIEAQHFPRFVIGESLLTHCLDFVAEAGMLEAVEAAGFRHKNGAAFVRGDEYGDIDFSEQFTQGRTSTFQVQRALFDKVLADEAQRQGVPIQFGMRVVGFESGGEFVQLRLQDEEKVESTVQARFVLDGSGFGRVLPKLLDLETPSDFPARAAVFSHVVDDQPQDAFDRNKIQVVVHPHNKDVWFWVIPFSGQRCSIGCVAAREFFANYPKEPIERLQQLVSEEPFMSRIFGNATWDTPVRTLEGYAANVKTMTGPGFALLGNAAEFLDPVFSSGVTIAMRSASTAAHVLDRQLRGETVDWKQDFEMPLRKGVNVFRHYVDAWYDGRFQDIMFSKSHSPKVRAMISSVLAGYAWDEANPFVSEAGRRLDVVAQLCRQERAPAK
ncbi:MAG TPA: NAD(P)/FAD-dependent oxidoreductase [Steroidobacteraceae bacterium]|nr:NAD(P)/FAD-dependent oxidoreductase [Steroidobacteraceae bacterium]